MITNYIDYKMPAVYSIKYIRHTCCIKFMWVYSIHTLTWTLYNRYGDILCSIHYILQSSTFLRGLNLKLKINIKNILNISVFIFLFPSTHTSITQCEHIHTHNSQYSLSVTLSCYFFVTFLIISCRADDGNHSVFESF